MVLQVVHQKVNNIANWTQADLDAQIAAGNFAPGTTLNDIVLAQDWNSNHSISGTIAAADVTGLATVATSGSYNDLSSKPTIVGTVTASAPLASSGGTSPNISLTGTIPVTNGGTGTSTALTQGSVVFAGASGVYSQDNANLYWDDPNNRLGIGTASPSTHLHLKTTAAGNGGVRVTGFSGQTANLIEAENSSGTAQFYVSPTGSVFCGGQTGGSDPTAFTFFLGTNNTNVARFKCVSTSADFVVKSSSVPGAASMEFNSSDSSTSGLVFATRDGNTFALTARGRALFGLGGALPTDDGVSTVQINKSAKITATATNDIPLITKGFSGQTANLQEIQNSSAGVVASFGPTGILGLGLASTQTGQVKFNGTTSGTVTLSIADAAGTWTMKLPTGAGTSGQVLQTDGSGNTSWASAGGSGTTNYINTTQVDQTPASGTYGTLAGSVNGTNTVYTVSNSAYVAGSIVVVLNGQIQQLGTDFTETTPASGTFTFAIAPPTGSVIQASYIKTATTSGTGNSPVILATVAGINAKSTGTTTLYTVPTGKTAIITQAIVRCTAASAITNGPVLGIGVAAGEDDIYASTAANALTTTAKIFGFGTIGMSTAAQAGDVIKVGIDTASTGTSQTIAIDLIGYLL